MIIETKDLPCIQSRQAHGFVFEEIIKKSFYFSGDMDDGSDPWFDIEHGQDARLGLPTQIKASKGRIIALASARRLWRICDDFRLVVGFHQSNKIFEVREYIIKKRELARLKANIEVEEIDRIHNLLIQVPLCSEVGIERFNTARQEIGRNIHCLFADKDKIRFRLNPKIDSKGQRRLQASVPIKILDTVIPSCRILIEKNIYGGIHLPFALQY